MSIAQLKTNQVGTIKKYTDLRIEKRLVSLGLIIGTEVRVYQKSVFGLPLIIEYNTDQQLAIRTSEAKHILLD